MIVFSSQWFKKYQRALLLYANTLGRDRLQIETGKRIIGIESHSVTWQEDKHGLRSTAFYSRSPFADALKMDLFPFWKLLHSIDMSFMARKLSLNFGFDTLTKYPDAHVETTTVDGYVKRDISTGETYATIRAGTGSAFDASVTYSSCIGLASHATGSGTYTSHRRAITLFNTVALTAGANISAATFRICSDGLKSVLLGDTNICLVTSDPASNTALAASDYERTFGTTDLFTTAFPISTLVSGANTKSVNAAGLAIISKTGITKLGLKLGWDLTGDTTGLVWASGAKSTYPAILWADYGTPATYAPQLIVTYTTFIPRITWM